MKRREYLGCPIDPETWYAINCADCPYSAQNENGEHDHCMNYDEWDDDETIQAAISYMPRNRVYSDEYDSKMISQIDFEDIENSGEEVS